MSMQEAVQIQNFSVRDRAREAQALRRKLMGIPHKAVRQPLAPREPARLIDDDEYTLLLREWFTGEPVDKLSVLGIITHVARFYGTTRDDVISGRRHAAVVKPRMVAYYLAHEHTLLTFVAIGRVMRRDYSSVMHGVRTIKRQLETDPKLPTEIATIKAMLGLR